MRPEGQRETDERLLVLDVHGVVFNNPLMPFLTATAERLGRDREAVLHRWAIELRRPFWLGQLDVAEMWSTLFPEARPEELTTELEQRHAPGPLYQALLVTEVPAWLLSNHRTDWLLRRISRFGLDGRFERIYVSDAIGHVKPEIDAFRFVQDLAGGRRVRYVDDKAENVRAAGTVFDESIHVRDADRLFHPLALGKP